MDNSFEIIIIGGGPAGASAAIYLSLYGFDVCVVEKKSFPRDTLCGEFLSFEVIHQLKELNLFEKFLHLQPNLITSFRFINDDGKSINADFDFDTFGLKRSTFDNFLLSAAKEKGVQVIQPAEVIKIKKEPDHFIITVKNEDNKNVQLTADKVIAAYGKQNILDKILSRNYIHEKSRLNGIKFHVDAGLLNGYDKREIQIYSAEGIYCGVNGVNENQVTLCFLENRYKIIEPPRKQLLKLREMNTGFASLLNSSFEEKLNDLPIYGTGNIYFGRKDLVSNEIFMIGDAAGVIAPLAGDGIGMAFLSAKILAECFHLNKRSKIRNNDLPQYYINHWEKNFRRRLVSAKMIQKIILNDSLRRAGFFTARLFPPLLPQLIKATRT